MTTTSLVMVLTDVSIATDRVSTTAWHVRLESVNGQRIDLVRMVLLLGGQIVRMHCFLMNNRWQLWED